MADAEHLIADQSRARYDCLGRVKSVAIAGGFTFRYSYYSRTGDLQRIVLGKTGQGDGGETETVSIKSGRITEIRQSDGGTTAIGSVRDGSPKGLIRSARTPGNVQLSHDYDSRMRLEGLTVGEGDHPGCPASAMHTIHSAA